MASANITYLEQYIKDGNKESLSLRNLYDTVLIGDSPDPSHIYRAPFGDFFVNHQAELEDIIELQTIPEEFFYRPKNVSLMLYQTTELWLALLRVNNMRNVSEFHLPLIRIYNPARLNDIINIMFKRENKI